MKLQLKRIRKEKKLSQTQLANMVGANLRTIGSWERGETMMSIEQLCNCCDALGCTPNDLTGWYIEHPEDMPAAPPQPEGDPFERELVDCYRGSTAEGKANILGNARGQAALSLNAAEGAQHEAEVRETAEEGAA